MNDADLEALVMNLRSTTQLVRLMHDEAKTLVATILARPEVAALFTAPKTDA